MTEPYDVLSQLLSPAQADTLSATGHDSWGAVAAALQVVFAGVPAISGVAGRLVMPDEITGEFADPHLVAPIEVSTDQEQTANAYLVVKTLNAAEALDSQADDASDQEQQTIVVASTILGQVLQSLNARVFSRSPAGLVLSMDDLGANSMPEILATMDDPMLALSATITAGQRLAVTLILPGTFLDIVAAAMAPASTAEASVSAESDDSRSVDPVPLTLTAEDLDLARLIGDEPSEEPVFASARSAANLGANRDRQASREPTPMAQTPAAQRARFAPLPDPPATTSRSGIDLLAGLQMNVTVELGRTELTVADVLGLGPGSVIELDRLAGEPVDILVNDRLIARGEVVVVDENFGVRVVEVVRRGVEQEERVS
ncbi:MAG: flagellar motor switch protein FliN [Tepidiformaceae bacterium]